MDLGPRPRLQLRQARGDVGQLYRLLPLGQLGDKAGRAPRTDQPQRHLLTRELGFSDGDLRLQRAQHEIVRRDLGGNADLDVANVPFGGFGARPCALDAAADAAEQVDLPRCVEAERPGRDALARPGDTLSRRLAPTAAAAERLRDRADPGVLAEVDAVDPGTAAQRRQSGRSRLALLRPRPGDAAACRREVEVAGERTVDQRCQERIVKPRPPLPRLGPGRIGQLGLGEARRDRQLGARIVGADGARR